MRPRRVQLLFGNGGGGHRASARAVLDAVGPAVHAELVDASALAGAAPGDALYNLFLAHNAVPLIELLHSVVAALLPLVSGPIRGSFRAFWAKPARCPDLVVSFVPMLNGIFAEALPPHVPLVTVMTDFSHTTPHPWIQHPRQHIVAGTDAAFRQALERGFLPPECPGPSAVVTRSQGMVVHPHFYRRLLPSERKVRLLRMNLDPEYPTFLVLFGAHPPTDRVADLVMRLAARQRDKAVNVIVVCGKNAALRERLCRRQASRALPRVHVVGFTTDIPLFMQLADVMVGKPGPGVVSEAFVSRLPVILIVGSSDASVMKQERDVMDWVRATGIGLVVRNARDASTIMIEQINFMAEKLTDQPVNDAVFQVGKLIARATGLEDLIDDDVDVVGRFLPPATANNINGADNEEAGHVCDTSALGSPEAVHAPSKQEPSPLAFSALPYLDGQDNGDDLNRSPVAVTNAARSQSRPTGSCVVRKSQLFHGDDDGGDGVQEVASEHR